MTLDRVARKLLEKDAEGDPIRNIQSYIQAVAARVASEQHRGPQSCSFEEASEPLARTLPDGADERRGYWLDRLCELIQALPEKNRRILLTRLLHRRAIREDRPAAQAFPGGCLFAGCAACPDLSDPSATANAVAGNTD